MFLSVDPLVAISGDPYLYASANPIALSDPTGLCDGSCFISLPSSAVPVGGCSADPDVCNGYNSVEGRSKIRQGWKDEGAWRYRWRDQPRPNTGLPGDGMGYLSVSGGEIWADGRVGPDPATGRYDYDPNEIMWLSDIALNFILGSIGMKMPGSTAPASASVVKTPLAIGPAGNPGAFTSAINVTTKGTNHTLARHFPGGVKTAGKSIFNAGESIPDLATAAQRVAPATQANTNLVRIVDAGRTVGIDVATGQPTSVYTVVTTSSGNLVTMHPGVP